MGLGKRLLMYLHKQLRKWHKKKHCSNEELEENVKMVRKTSNIVGALDGLVPMSCVK